MRSLGVLLASVVLAAPFAGLPTMASADPIEFPENVTATPVAGVGVVEVYWDPPPNVSVDEYRVYLRPASTGSYQPVAAGSCAMVAGTDTTCTVTGLTPGTDYDFIVTAVAGGVEGAQSAVAMVTAIQPPGAPAMPAAANTASVQMEVTWTGVSATTEARSTNTSSN